MGIVRAEHQPGEWCRQIPEMRLPVDLYAADCRTIRVVDEGIHPVYAGRHGPGPKSLRIGIRQLYPRGIESPPVDLIINMLHEPANREQSDAIAVKREIRVIVRGALGNKL